MKPKLQLLGCVGTSVSGITRTTKFTLSYVKEEIVREASTRNSVALMQWSFLYLSESIKPYPEVRIVSNSELENKKSNCIHSLFTHIVLQSWFMV